VRIAIVGLGAVGGLLAARLAAAGETVSALARGDTLRNVERDGLRVLAGGEPEDAGGVERVRIDVRTTPAELGEQDLVVVALKAPALAGVASTLAPLLGNDTVVVPVLNGVPWWFFHGLDPALSARRWETIDGEGIIGRALPAARVVGCVVHLACSTPRPGVILHASGNRLIFGEPDGTRSARVERIAALFAHAGFDAELSPRIQQEVWFKLWGNMTINPISAITGATTDRIMDDPLVRDFVSATMREAAAVGADHAQARRVPLVDAAGRRCRPAGRARCAGRERGRDCARGRRRHAEHRRAARAGAAARACARAVPAVIRE